MQEGGKSSGNTDREHSLEWQLRECFTPDCRNIWQPALVSRFNVILLLLNPPFDNKRRSHERVCESSEQRGVLF